MCKILALGGQYSIETRREHPFVSVLCRESTEMNGSSMPRRFLLVVFFFNFAAVSLAQDKPELTPEQREGLNAIGYTGTAVTDTRKEGVTRIDKNGVCPGFRLFASGSAPIADLIDVNGRIFHTWQMKPWKVDAKFVRVYPPSEDFFRTIHMFDDGSLLVVFEGIGLAKLDKDSQVLWRVQNRAHHALDIAANGDIYLLRQYTRIIPRIKTSEPVIDDLVAILDSEGREKDAISILEALENSKDYGHLWKNYAMRKYINPDLLHSNSVKILDGTNEQTVPGFKKGNLLVSLAYLDAVVVIDPEKREVVWANQGPYKVQHDPTILDNGDLLVFDNRSIWAISRVLEFKLPSMEVAWSFTGSKEEPFFSLTCGTSQRLPNGNTLIAETDNGRAIEVSSAQKIVWEFYDPHRTDKDKSAKIFTMHWLPNDIKPFWK